MDDVPYEVIWSAAVPRGCLDKLTFGLLSSKVNLLQGRTDLLTLGKSAASADVPVFCRTNFLKLMPMIYL
jgi:hypothetical protein